MSCNAMLPSFDQIPCPVLVTDRAGVVQSLNQDLLKLLGGVKENWLKNPMENMFSMASRVFLQTHVWPLVLREGQVREIHLQIMNQAKKKVPVYVNCQKAASGGVDICTWVFYVTLERSSYEQELLQARQRADEMAAELTQSERFIRTVADAMPGTIAYWDTELHCQFVNKTYQTWFGKSNEDMQGVAIQTILGSRLFEQNYSYIKKVLNGENQEFERSIEKQDGSMTHGLINYIADIDKKGKIKGFFSLFTDISGLREADAAIRLSASVFEATTEGIIVTDEKSNIISINSAFSKLTGYTPRELIGKNAGILKSDLHEDLFFKSLYQKLDATLFWKGEIWTRRKDGSIYLGRFSVSAIPAQDNVIRRYVGVTADITEQRDKEKKAQFMALHDGLTGLPNRSLLMERVGQLIAASSRQSHQVGLLFLDLDGFKLVNDSWGHGHGDKVLQTVAARLAKLIRPADTVARIGGDEFVILLDNPESQNNVARIASRIIQSVNVPISIDGKNSQIGTSIGIAFYNDQILSPDELLKKADMAMYKAKAAGKNTYHFSN